MKNIQHKNAKLLILLNMTATFGKRSANQQYTQMVQDWLWI